MPMPRTDWLDRHALHHPDAPALVWVPTGDTYTYGELNRMSAQVAAVLVETYALEPGDRVAVLAPNTVEHVLLFAAAQKAGLVLVPLNSRLGPSELAPVVSDSAPALICVASTHASAIQNVETGAHLIPLDDVMQWARAASSDTPAGAWTAPAFDDPLMIVYTSGTTGTPKGAVLTHKMLFWNAVNTQMRLDLTTADRSVNAAPFHHTGGWNVLLTPFLHQGATTYLLPGFDAGRILNVCDTERLTVLWGVPTMFRTMAQHENFTLRALASVRYAVVGGEAMPEPLIREWHDKGVPIRQGYGLTEVGVNCFSLPERDSLRKIGSIGFPNFYLDMRVISADGRDVPPGTPGELLLRGPVVIPGYWRNPDATAAAIDDDGWFHTGDRVRVDDEGYTYVVGRLTDMYISGGENVYPAEVEAVLHAHPAVAEAAVVGVPDDTWGEAGAAFVVPAAERTLTADAVLSHARDHLAGYKIPKHVRVLDALPKGPSGKIQKAVLADRVPTPPETPSPHGVPKT